MTLDGHHRSPSLPIQMQRAFDLPPLPPSRHMTYHNARPHPLFPSDTLAGTPKARFRDDELHDRRSASLPKWSGRDREGILVWARAIAPGLDDAYTPPDVDAASMTDAVLAAFHFTRPPFPLTSQNLAPPSVTVTPHHVLLNHTSLHSPSHHDEPTVPSLSQDDTSLLTPATGSVITPSAPDPNPRASSKPLGHFIHKFFYSWIAPPSRTPRATPEGLPTFSSADEGSEDDACHYVASLGRKVTETRSSAIKIADSSVPSRPYAQALRPRIHAA